jgi:hypothetical protein
MTEGQWHKDHSFGDFCEFCHGGNTASTVKAEAHADFSMIPVENPGNACSSCHPNDYQERAQEYAELLNIEIPDAGAPVAAAPSGDSDDSDESSGGTAAESSGESATTTASGGSSISIPSGGEVVDFNELLNEADKDSTVNVGNLIFIGLIIGLGFVWAGLFWSFNKEKITEKFQRIASEPPIDAGESEVQNQSVTQDEILRTLNDRPQLRQLFMQLKDSDPAVLDALISITGQNGNSEKLIKTIGKLDLNLMKSLQNLRESELDVLLTLAKKM